MSEKSDGTTLSQLTLFAEDSLASLTVLPGSNEARKMTATSGLNIAALLPNSDPAGWLARMFLESEPPFSMRCYLTWMVWTTPQSRLIFRLSPSMPRTDGIDSLLWPTPKQGGNRNSRGAILGKNTDGKHKSSLALEQAVEVEAGILPKELETVDELPPKYQGLWPTPSSQGSAGEISPDLERCGAKLVNSKTGRVLQTNLATEVKWSNGPGSLNPPWVEWLMGFPIGYTEVE